ncbi:hypothetical protein GCM10010967_56200 [Dyadobacter beijingensis]|uniref:Multidrug transporter n=1 Tax=Dyadobacter beijingensis TaxID=365489 RepID=A0ABQ2IK52_9BACT|nr:bestrophin family ion channel [Dyadobacter beijingensis]GGN12928.1 hypothetical protein GCM10010967_56200 [Dyadobacter beijingensis]
MIITKTLSLKAIYEFTGHQLFWLTGWMTLVTLLYYFTGWKILAFPSLPLPLIGTAVAFYVGFKNNQSYDRLWESRKIWGEITNTSRILASTVKNYHSGEPNAKNRKAVRRQIVFRHIAYLYQLREQLLEPAEWEHVSPTRSWLVGHKNWERRAYLNGRFKAELDSISMEKYLPEQELLSLECRTNKATHLLDTQAGVIQRLFDGKVINMIQQIELQGSISSLHSHQGRLERIKQSPFPRKYATYSFLFVCIFIFFLPFGMIGEFRNWGQAGIWLSIPVGTIIGWIFVAMEMIGDYSENPFEGLHNDIPMLAICRGIEIDMLEMIGEKNIPSPIEAKGQTLL